MKYAQLVMGLLIGTALGGSVVAATSVAPAAGGNAALDTEAVKKIVRETIASEPQLILDSVQKYQQSKHEKDAQGASEAMKDKQVHDFVYDPKTAASYGPADSKHVLVQFFDYNCPACKFQHKELDALLAKDKTVRVIFREYPIFGPTSEENSRLGLAVFRLAPEKYFEFYEKMMNTAGHAEEKTTLGYIKDLGLDVDKVQAESKSPAIADILEGNRAVGEKLHIQGTPTIIIGDEVTGHALPASDIEAKFAPEAK